MFLSLRVEESKLIPPFLSMVSDFFYPQPGMYVSSTPFPQRRRPY